MSEEKIQDQSKAIVKRNRFFGLVILAIVTAPMLLAYVMFQTGWGISSDTTNKGQLLTPALSVQELDVVDDKNVFKNLFSDKSIDDKNAAKKWRLLVPVTAACSDACQKNLYTTRQVHIRLAEKAYRVERIILSLDELTPELSKRLENEHPNTLRIASNGDYFSQWLAPTDTSELAQQQYYLIDQEGFAMMAYDTSHTGQDLLDDIKKLLKFTYDK